MSKLVRMRETRPPTRGWSVVAASAVASATGFASILIYTFGSFIKPLSAEFGWSRQTISTAFACASFTLGLCSPALGYLLDRFGPDELYYRAFLFLRPHSARWHFYTRACFNCLPRS